MTTHIQRRLCATALVTLASTFALAALAAVPVHIVKTDLKAGIRAGSESPVQFAVLVPHAVSTSGGGSWSTAGDRATWRYAVQVPTAVSLSFHATRSVLPAGAVLVVRGAKTTTSYGARDLHNGDLWSRIQPGDGLQFTLTVTAADRSKVALNIVSLQAGYRSLGPGVRDHPYYRQLKAQLNQATDNTACTTNYECEVTSSNTPPAQATVALVVGNLHQCTGVLINDVPGDNTPYVLTARHCQSGQLGGGNPGAASTVVVYWDASTPCGTPAGSVYDANIPTQTGAQTIVEQQDAWLIELDATPVVSDAQLAGFDASGGTVQGGYTIHHAEGFDKQFTEWFGQAFPVQESVTGTTYVSNFWQTVNQLGNIAPGASGSGLFDQNNHLVGLLSLGRPTNDPSGYEACPVMPLKAPSALNGAADFTSLAAVWSSTADSSSSTGGKTLKSVLDPGDTGTVVVSSLAAAVIRFTPLTTTQFGLGSIVALDWTAANATQCTASGGVAGDGWSGTQPGSGSLSVTEVAPATVTYTLTCTFSGGRTARASVTLTWVVTPQLQFNVPNLVWTTRPAVLSWTSNVGPCAISGGGLSLTGLPESGSTTTTQASAGDVTYTLSCGPSNNNETLGGLVTYVTPSLTFAANGTDRLLGQTFFLQWLTYADSCVPAGGAPNDGWATNAFPQNFSIAQFSPTVTTAGTYTYTLSCTSGPISLQKSVTVTFENNAPYVTASLNPSTVTFSDSPADYATLTWNSNLSSCNFSSVPNLPVAPNNNAPFGSVPLPQGSQTLAPYQSGTYQMTMTCTVPSLNGTSVTSTPLILTVMPPPPPTASISINPPSLPVGKNFTVRWSSTNALSCTETGSAQNIGGEVWGPNNAPSGSFTLSLMEAGQWTFGITCDSIDTNVAATASAQATLTVGITSLTLTASPAAINQGASFTLTWTSTGSVAGCTATGGGANGTKWTGSLSTSGSVTQTATTVGTFTYTINCTDGNAQASADTTVTVAAAGGGGSGGGHGGGGAIGFLELALLAGMCSRRRCACST